MPGLSDFAAKNVLNYITGQVPMPSLPAAWLALFTAVGADDGTGFTEVTGGSYARVQIAGSVTTNATTAAGSAVLNFASVPSWIVAGMVAFDNTSSVIPAGTTVLSKTATTVTLSANVTGGGVGNGDSISFSAFARSTGTGPSSITNSAAISFAQASASWGNAVAWGIYDASSSGNLQAWDYLGNYSWLPATVSSASPGVITAKAHGYANGDSFVFTTEYGGTAPSFSAGNFNGVMTVAGAATDTLQVTGVNTSSTGSGNIRKVGTQSIPNGITATFAASSLTLQAA